MRPRPLLLAILLILLTLPALYAALPALAPLDSALLHPHPALVPAALALTALGRIAVFGPPTCVLMLLFLRARRSAAALFLGVAIGGALLLNESLKLLFHRPRPHLPWSIASEHTFAFPSGHSLFAVVLYGALATLALRLRAPRPLAALACAAAVLLPLAIGSARVVLAAHAPTDVLAGWLTGLFWLRACQLASQPPQKLSSAGKPQNSNKSSENNNLTK